MPVHKEGSGYQWGKHGKVYPDRAGAERQARAAYANGYTGMMHGGMVTPRYQPRQVKGASPQIRPAFMTRRFGG